MTIYSAASGMVLEQHRQELIARNLAGSQMPGYKKEFLLSNNFKADLTKERMQNTNKFQGASGGTEKTDFTQGALKKTSDPLDFAIHGEGFFLLEDLEGNSLDTRNGSFTLNNDGFIVNSSGAKLIGNNGGIQLSPADDLNELRMSNEGELILHDGTERRSVAQLKIVDIENRDLFEKISSSNFRLDEKSERLVFDVDTGDTHFSLMNNYLETSNASPIQDMTTMVQSMREFELGQKMLKMLDDTGKQVASKLSP